MAIHIGTLRPPSRAHKRRKRVGQGMGSGHGKTATRGSKGQRSRAGMRMRPGFQGGQMPSHRRLPKRGFTNIFRTAYQVVNVGDLNRVKSNKVSPDVLFQNRLIDKRNARLKVLGNGEVKKAYEVQAHAFSKKAIEKLEAAGGKAIPL